MSLYQKHRPSSLRGVKGNEKVVGTLKSMTSDLTKIPHAFLLSGPTGCGKTTIARIIKGSLAVSDSDFFEMNSSDDRGIDSIRALIKNCQYRPLESEFRIYLLDECHMLTKDAQNALLKILEDTPKHVVFILCTTDPDKLIKAIRGRCQSFSLEQLSDQAMTSLLKRIVKKEKREVADEVISTIIETAEGHPRNAIQILEQVLNTDEENQLEAAKLDQAQKNESIELCRALIANTSWKQISKILNGLKGQDAESIRRHVLGYAQSVLLRGDNDKAALILEEFIDPFFHTGFPQVVYACYSVTKNS